MTFISKDLANKIAKKIADEKFSVIIKELDTKRKTIGDEIYETIFDAKLCQSLPDGYLPEVSGFDVVNENGWKITASFSTNKPIPNSSRYTQKNLKNDNLWERCKVANAAYDNAVQDNREAIGELEKNIFAFRTIKRLLAQWPEIENFVPQYAKQPKMAVAVPVMALNQKYGLPPESAGAA